ncbi:uncharacterized protein LOC126816526 isoform X2 [Patella vulgata]|uniref:uncharacterized protein LOC126816526 isoform X2 n=1 Tax=Patella vulgata TaxID=6465 RepID=UPI0024A928B3|nr:uncharacterized protein LOC126816526 isoform X2 [Patella vulgata]
MSSKTKRALYKPVQKQAVTPKRTRKPLAQGRLVTDTNTSTSNDIKKTNSTHQHARKTAEDSLPITPRKNVPEILVTQSSHPSSNLDLSDLDVTESESNTQEISNESVIVVDATETSLNPDQSEVHVAIGMKKSPVRVVRHTARVSDKQNKKTDQPSKSNFQPTQAISPLVKGRKTIRTDGPRSNSRHRASPLTKKKVKDTKTSYPQPNFNDSAESLTTEQKIVCEKPTDDEDDDDIQSVISDMDACSIDEYVPIIKSKTKPGTKSNSKTSTVTKAKKGISIPSRYMQASAKTSTSLVNQKTSSGAKHSASNKSLPSHKPATPGRSHKPATPSMPSKPAGGKTSTPCSSEALPNTTQDMDTSAIPAEISAISADLSTLYHSKKYNTSSIIQQKKRPKKQDIKMSQQRLDVIWSRYLQWLYLDSRAKTVFKEQEKAAMGQLNMLWEEVEALHEKEASLKLELVRLKHLNELDDQLELQNSGLEPVINNLPVISNEYHELAASLDTTRHQISTKGIYIPDDEDTFQASLENSLQESENLLGQISMMVRQQTPKTSQFSTALQTTEKVVDSECSELKKCRELLAASQSLITQESSLKIQSIQSH